jgi:excinuclease ABC subunit C
MAKRSLQQQMQTRMQAKIHVSERLSALMLALSLDKLPVRMECFDISHTGSNGCFLCGF